MGADTPTGLVFALVSLCCPFKLLTYGDRNGGDYSAAGDIVVGERLLLNRAAFVGYKDKNMPNVVSTACISNRKMRRV